MSKMVELLFGAATEALGGRVVAFLGPPAFDGDAEAAPDLALWCAPLRQTSRKLAACCAGAAAAGAAAAVAAIVEEIGAPVVAGRGHRALAMRRYRAALAAACAPATTALSADVVRALIGVLGDETCSPWQLAAARCLATVYEVAGTSEAPLLAKTLFRRGLLRDLLRRNFYLDPHGVLTFGSLSPYDARSVAPREAFIDCARLVRAVHAAGETVDDASLADVAHAIARVKNKIFMVNGERI